MDPGPDIEQLAELMAAGMRRRSPLMVWLIEHHDEFAALLYKYGADWDGLAGYFSKSGLRTRAGKPLGARTVKNCWFRAQRHVAKQREKRSASVEAPKLSRATDEALSAPGAPVEPPQKPKRKFAFVRLRNEGRGASAAERRTLGDPTVPGDPDNPR